MNQATKVKKVTQKGDSVYFSLTEEAINLEGIGPVYAGTPSLEHNLNFSYFVKLPELCVSCLTPLDLSKAEWYTVTKTQQISALNVQPVLFLYGKLKVPLCTNCQKMRRSAQARKDNEEQLNQDFPQVVAYKNRREAIALCAGSLFGIAVGLLVATRLQEESTWLLIVVGLGAAIGMFLMVVKLFDIVSKVIGKFPQEVREYDRLMINLSRIKIEHPVDLLFPQAVIHTPLLGSKSINKAFREYLRKPFGIQFHDNRQFAEKFTRLNR